MRHNSGKNSCWFGDVTLNVDLVLCFRFGPYFIEPVIAGLDPKTLKPFVASLDLIGCPMITDDFVVSGTCTEQLYGMCESLWEPDLVRLFFSSKITWCTSSLAVHVEKADYQLFKYMNSARGIMDWTAVPSPVYYEFDGHTSYTVIPFRAAHYCDFTQLKRVKGCINSLTTTVY